MVKIRNLEDTAHSVKPGLLDDDSISCLLSGESLVCPWFVVEQRLKGPFPRKPELMMAP